MNYQILKICLIPGICLMLLGSFTEIKGSNRCAFQWLSSKEENILTKSDIINASSDFNKTTTNDSILIKLMNIYNAAKKSNSSIEKAKIELLLGDYYYEKQELVLAGKYYDTAITSAKEINDYLFTGNASLKLASVKQALMEYNEAVFYCYNAMEMFKTNNFHREYGFSLYMMGNIYMSMESEIESLEYYFKALMIFDKIKDFKYSGASNFKIATLYFNRGDFEKYLHYTTEAMEKYKAIRDTSGVKACYINYGNYYFNKNQYNSALLYYDTAYFYSRYKRDKRNMTICLGNIGATYTELGNTKLALKYFNEANDIARQTKDVHSLISNNYNISLIYLKNNNYIKSKQLLIDCIELAKKISNKRFIYLCYQQLSKCDSMVGNFKDAYLNMYFYSVYRDSLISEENNRQVILSESKYRNELYKNNIKVLNLEKNQQLLAVEAAKGKNRLFFIVFFSILTALFFLTVLVVVRLRSRQKISLFKETEKMKTEQIQAIVQTQEQERRRMAMDLHDGIGQKLTSVMYKFDHFKNFTNYDKIDREQAVNDVYSIINECYQDVRSLSYQIMPKALFEAGIVHAIEELLLKTFRKTSVRYSFNNHTSVSIPEDISLNIYRIVQELISNTIKHSKADEVSVSFIYSNGYLILIFEDNGIGVPPGFDVKRSTGVGFQDILARLSLHQGVLTIENGLERGIIITIRIPFILSNNTVSSYEKTD